MWTVKQDKKYSAIQAIAKIKEQVPPQYHDDIYNLITECTTITKVGNRYCGELSQLEIEAFVNLFVNN